MQRSQLECAAATHAIGGQTMDIQFATDFQHQTMTIARWRSLVLVRWHQPPTLEALRLAGPVFKSVVRRQGGMVLFCAVADASMPTPDNESREATQRAIRDLEGHLAAACNVIVGSGFRAATMRAMLSGFTLIVRQNYPTTTVGTVDEGVAFLLKHWPAADAPIPGAVDLARALVKFTVPAEG